MSISNASLNDLRVGKAIFSYRTKATIGFLKDEEETSYIISMPLRVSVATDINSVKGYINMSEVIIIDDRDRDVSTSIDPSIKKLLARKSAEKAMKETASRVGMLTKNLDIIYN